MDNDDIHRNLGMKKAYKSLTKRLGHSTPWKTLKDEAPSDHKLGQSSKHWQKRCDAIEMGASRFVLIGTWVSGYADYLQGANVIGNVRFFAQDLDELARPKFGWCENITNVVAKDNVGVDVPFREVGEDWMAFGACFEGVGV